MILLKKIGQLYFLASYMTMPVGSIPRAFPLTIVLIFPIHPPEDETIRSYRRVSISYFNIACFKRDYLCVSRRHHTCKTGSLHCYGPPRSVYFTYCLHIITVPAYKLTALLYAVNASERIGRGGECEVHEPVDSCGSDVKPCVG